MLQHPHTQACSLPDTLTSTHTESRSSQESLQMRDVYSSPSALVWLSLRSVYLCSASVSSPRTTVSLPSRKWDESISKETGKDTWRVCLSVCIWGGLPMFRQSCYKHQKHQWAAFSEALQNPLAIMSPSPPPESLWKQWRHWSPIDCNDSHADRQEPAGQQLHQSPTAFNDSQRNWGTIVGAAMELTVSVQ